MNTLPVAPETLLMTMTLAQLTDFVIAWEDGREERVSREIALLSPECETVRPQCVAK